MSASAMRVRRTHDVVAKAGTVPSPSPPVECTMAAANPSDTTVVVSWPAEQSLSDRPLLGWLSPTVDAAGSRPTAVRSVDQHLEHGPGL